MSNTTPKPASASRKVAATQALKRHASKSPAARKTPIQTVRGQARRILNFTDVAMMPKLDLIDMIRAGVPPGDFKEMVKRMDASQERVVKFLGVSTATINRKSARNENLSRDESAKVIGLASLIGQVQTMVDCSGDPAGFDAAKWVSNWLEQPIPALGGRKPADLMDTPPGQEIISNLVAMMETGAYA